VIAVHNVATREEEDLLAAEGYALSFCLCPNANLYIGGRLPDVECWSEAAGLSSSVRDSLASNKGLSILEELKTLQRVFSGIGNIRAFGVGDAKWRCGVGDGWTSWAASSPEKNRVWFDRGWNWPAA